MKVAVGSNNPIKIEATKNIFNKVFGNTEILSVKVETGVSHTPSSWEETAQGAINRAKEAIKKTGADFGVGLEGGYEKTKFGVLMRGAVAIIDKKGRLGISGSNGILLPEKIVKRLEKGEELGDIMDDIQKVKNTKQKWGAVGFFLKKFTNRQESFEQTILYALARFLRKDLYKK